MSLSPKNVLPGVSTFYPASGATFAQPRPDRRDWMRSGSDAPGQRRCLPIQEAWSTSTRISESGSWSCGSRMEEKPNTPPATNCWNVMTVVAKNCGETKVIKTKIETGPNRPLASGTRVGGVASRNVPMGRLMNRPNSKRIIKCRLRYECGFVRKSTFTHARLG